MRKTSKSEEKSTRPQKKSVENKSSKFEGEKKFKKKFDGSKDGEKKVRKKISIHKR